MKKRGYVFIICLLIMILVTSTIVSTSTNAAVAATPVPVGRVTVTFVITSDWGMGCLYSVTIKNKTSQPIPWEWKLSWRFIGDQRIGNIWNMNVTQSGSSVVVTPRPYSNSNIPAGGTFNFGFTVTGTGRGVTDVQFNGVPVLMEALVI